MEGLALAEHLDTHSLEGCESDSGSLMLYRQFKARIKDSLLGESIGLSHVVVVGADPPVT